ncbi:hypothetical protein EVAR_78012_1 [Eumeta japonica]|uniref:Uncharacterized protein n=1 Tax=Eumeta variegata TaxID=151549 RepID=A0A4C1SZX6_EUMVA|nr:hypothetical protein EVAR_78012_1 [Eumeta japonica]
MYIQVKQQEQFTKILFRDSKVRFLERNGISDRAGSGTPEPSLTDERKQRQLLLHICPLYRAVAELATPCLYHVRL